MAHNLVNQLNNAIPILGYVRKDDSDVELIKLASYLTLLAKEPHLVKRNSEYFNLGAIRGARTLYAALDGVFNRRGYKLEEEEIMVVDKTPREGNIASKRNRKVTFDVNA